LPVKLKIANNNFTTFIPARFFEPGM